MRSKLENNSCTAWSTRTLSPVCPAKPGHHICAWYFEIGYCNKSASNSPIERFRGHACILTCLKLSSSLSIKCLHLCTMCKIGIGCAADNEHLSTSSLTAALHVLSMLLHHVSPAAPTLPSTLRHPDRSHKLAVRCSCLVFACPS